MDQLIHRTRRIPPYRVALRGSGLEPERLLSFRWHDFDENSDVDIAEQPTTLVEFRLEPTAEGAMLTITESGFDALPDPRRIEVLPGNTEGWNIQAENIAAHVASAG